MTAGASGATTVSRDGATVLVAVVGRATGPAVAQLRAAVEAALDRAEPFTVLFDRSRMTATTVDGRAELERWGAELTPRLATGCCLAWADLYDERRAASLARAGADHGPGLPYPQRTFADPAAAREWLHGFHA